MKFLIDRCAGTTIAVRLRAAGHDVVESRELGPDPGDEALLRLAHQQSRVLITLDSDFGRLTFLQKIEHSGLVRLPDVPAERRAELMEQLLNRHATELENGAVITVRGGRIRVSRTPPKPK